jgi:mxaJ protein
MSLLFLRFCVGVIISVSTIAAIAQPREIRVCADPNNLPFSNNKREGFENQIAAIVAKDLDAHLAYVWQRMGRGFVREYLNRSACDLLIGIPANYRPVLTTAPYYRSTYVFVSRRNNHLDVDSFNSPELHGLKIGVQVLEEEYTPPGEALARRGLQAAIVGYDTTEDAESIIRAVANQQGGIAVVWGPLAGYFAQKYHGTLALAPVEPEVDSPGLPFTFAISMGVRKGNTKLRDELDRVLVKRQSEIREILTRYGVPQLPLAPPSVQSAAK